MFNLVRAKEHPSLSPRELPRAAPGRMPRRDQGRRVPGEGAKCTMSPSAGLWGMHEAATSGSLQASTGTDPRNGLQRLMFPAPLPMIKTDRSCKPSEATTRPVTGNRGRASEAHSGCGAAPCGG
jgi:hypothetical protein